MSEPKKQTRNAAANATTHAGTKLISVRLPKSEVDTVDLLRGELDMTQTEVIVTAIRSLSAPNLSRAEWLRLGVELDELNRKVVRLATDVARIGANVNQIVRQAHIRGVDAEKLEQTYEALRECMAAFEDEAGAKLNELEGLHFDDVDDEGGDDGGGTES